MATTVVFANGNGNGNGNGHGNGNGNGGSNDNGNGKGHGHGNGNGNGNGRGQGHGNGIGGTNGNSNGNGNGHTGGNNEPSLVDQAKASMPTDQQTTSTDAVEQIVSTPAVQAPIIAIMITYPAAATVGLADGPAWWTVVESNVERLFRKFFFLTGSVGERIRRKNVLRNGKRREIYYFIVNNPFSHFRRITRMVGIGPNEGSWHLRILEKMNLIKSEHVGRYLTYHANNADYIGNQSSQPSTLIQNSNATKILEYLLRNPGTSITHVTRSLMMNRNTVAYHVKRLQTSGLIEREETNGLRLVRTLEHQGDGLTDNLVTPMASRIDLTPLQGKVVNISGNVESVRGA